MYSLCLKNAMILIYVTPGRLPEPFVNCCLEKMKIYFFNICYQIRRKWTGKFNYILMDNYTHLIVKLKCPLVQGARRFCFWIWSLSSEEKLTCLCCDFPWEITPTVVTRPTLSATLKTTPATINHLEIHILGMCTNCNCKSTKRAKSLYTPTSRFLQKSPRSCKYVHPDFLWNLISR